MHQQQQFPIDQEESKEEDQHNDLGFDNLGEQVLDEDDGRIGLRTLVLMDEIDSLDEKRFFIQYVDEDSHQQQQSTDDQHSH